MISFSDIFYYRDGKLYNKVTRGDKAKKDTEAGTVNNHGYRRVKIQGRLYFAHRIIWAIHNGDIPEGLEIDHVNHDRTDNRINNLRLVTPSENQRNQSIRIKSRSGVTGVGWKEANNKWQARIKVGGKDKYLGLLDDLELAELVMIEAREKYGYHANHGSSQHMSSGEKI